MNFGVAILAFLSWFVVFAEQATSLARQLNGGCPPYESDCTRSRIHPAD